MQINGHSLLTAYPQGTAEQRRDIARPPVIIDAEPKSTQARPLLPATTETAAYQAELTQESDRQARFVRLVAEQDLQQTTSADDVVLPEGIQQYQQVAELNAVSSQQRLFDELV